MGCDSQLLYTVEGLNSNWQGAHYLHGWLLEVLLLRAGAYGSVGVVLLR